ncbi:MAG TPA: CYTH domain-containing protein [Ilumatobacter sp.]|nr:CYTH domain-containing protein [Ilumatobacter sp.]
MIEIERRFLVDVVPEPLPRPCRIVQGYLMTTPAAVRVRSADGVYTLTIKSGSGLRRTEIERTLAAAEFDALWEVATDLRIEKRRHRIELGHGAVAELDLFDGDLAGRRLVEVEFDDESAAASFEPPEWFGPEVTTDPRFTNAALAEHGWPPLRSGRDSAGPAPAGTRPGHSPPALRR